MRILFDVNHPAHVHFFKNPARILKDCGHVVMFTSRKKECTEDLLDEFGFSHRRLSVMDGNGALSLLKELISRDISLYQTVRKFKPDVMAAIGGTFIAHVGAVTSIPSVVFYDTENAFLQNIITYPVATRVFVPRCYKAWLPRNAIRYSGYHELSYLSPNYFVPDISIAKANGLKPDQNNFLIRIVSWKASHDLNERGWSRKLVQKVVEKCLSYGNVIISTEEYLDNALDHLRYRGRASDIHHTMAFCRGFVGESATMASECAILGVPAIYAAQTGRGYTDEQEHRYGLVKNVRRLDYAAIANAIEDIMERDAEEHRNSRRRLLNDTIDVARYVAESIEKIAG